MPIVDGEISPEHATQTTANTLVTGQSSIENKVAGECGEIETLIDRKQVRLIGNERIYPRNAMPVVSSGAGAWQNGNLTQIIPANTIGNDFVILGVVGCDADTNGCYRVDIHAGEDDEFISEIGFTRSGVFTVSYKTEITSPIIPANSRVRVRSAHSVGGADVNIRLKYITV